MRTLSFNQVNGKNVQTACFEHLPNSDTATALETFLKPHIVATRAVAESYPMSALFFLVSALQAEAKAKKGIDYLQRFNVTYQGKTEEVWVIDDGYAVTVLYPSDY